MPRSLLTALLLAPVAAPAAAQSSPLTPVTEMTNDYRSVRDYVLAAAAEVPDSLYPFKPSPVVRSFAQQFAHIADDQYNLCGPAQGVERGKPYQTFETSLSTKAEILPVLRAAFAYCDAVYAATTEANATTLNGRWQHTRFGMLNWNMWHTWEHYGNIVVYLRINGMVPPSSMPMAMPNH